MKNPCLHPSIPTFKRWKLDVLSHRDKRFIERCRQDLVKVVGICVDTDLLVPFVSLWHFVSESLDSYAYLIRSHFSFQPSEPLQAPTRSESAYLVPRLTLVAG